MEERGQSEQWITVYELRTYFHLHEFTAPIISGFLRRLHHNTLFSCRYRVEKIEKIWVSVPQQRRIKRYLVQKRLVVQKNQTPDRISSNRSPNREYFGKKP